MSDSLFGANKTQIKNAPNMKPNVTKYDAIKEKIADKIYTEKYVTKPKGPNWFEDRI